MTGDKGRRAFLQRMILGGGALGFGALPIRGVSKTSSASTRVTGGFSGARLKTVSAAMQGFVDRGEAAGMVTVLYRHRELAQSNVVGWQNKEANIRMKADSIFRLASMSKPLVAVAALTLVDNGTLSLNDPVERFLPELGGRKVLRDANGPLDATVPASRSMRIVDLLTHRSGLTPGILPALTVPDLPSSPLTQAMIEADQARKIGPDAWVKAIAELPLVCNPGSSFVYGVSFDLLGVLLARASGMSLPDFMRARLFEPLGMRDSGFAQADSVVPRDKEHRLAVVYERDAKTTRLIPKDVTGLVAAVSPVTFPSAEFGMYSTAHDYLQAVRMLLDRGRAGNVRILSHRAVALMTSNHLPAEQRQDTTDDGPFWAGHGFGLGVMVVDNLAQQDAGEGPYNGYSSVGSYCWSGYFGTYWEVDPTENMIQMFMSQLLPIESNIQMRKVFQALGYQAIDD